MIFDLCLKFYSQTLTNKDVHLLGITSMFIAQKYEEVCVFGIKMFAKNVSHDEYSESDIKTKEFEILQNLGFSISFSSFFDLVNYHMSQMFDLKSTNQYRKLETITLLYILMCLHDVNVNDWDANKLVAACLYKAIEKYFGLFLLIHREKLSLQEIQNASNKEKQIKKQLLKYFQLNKQKFLSDQSKIDQQIKKINNYEYLNETTNLFQNLFPINQLYKLMKTSIQKAIQLWEEKNNQNASDSELIKLNFTKPPIDKLDTSVLSTLINCQQLSLSTNCIEKMVQFQGLNKLQILSLGRNQIKKIYGLEGVGATLKELWISYNLIEKLDNLAPHCTALTTFYIAHNKIKDWSELEKIKNLPVLTNCVFLGNEIYDKYQTKEEGRIQVMKQMPQLTMIDNVLVTEQDKVLLKTEENEENNS